MSIRRTTKNSHSDTNGQITLIIRGISIFSLLLLVLLASSVAVRPSWADQPDFHLQVVPAIVYRVDDPGNTGTSSFVFDIAVICSSDCELTPVSASVELSSGRSTVERQEWTTEMLAKLKGVSYRILPDTPVAFPRRIFMLPESFDLHFYFRRPQALAIDSADVRVRVADAKGRRAEQMLRVPIQYYQQKTSLIVPFVVWPLLGRTGSPTAVMAEPMAASMALTLLSICAVWMRTMQNKKTAPARTRRLRAGAARS